MFGTNKKINPYNLIIARLSSSIIIFIIVLYFMKYGYILAPVITFLYYMLFNQVVINNKIKKRMVKLENEAMHFFEVLTLSLETGRNLSGSNRCYYC